MELNIHNFMGESSSDYLNIHPPEEIDGKLEDKLGKLSDVSITRSCLGGRVGTFIKEIPSNDSWEKKLLSKAKKKRIEVVKVESPKGICIAIKDHIRLFYEDQKPFNPLEYYEGLLNDIKEHSFNFE
ncbi:hypothetical protein JW949_04525 [Candidatus Woesearchaeota archaeon]|nr:hypothetical protein [Candidatus Woesearchaeota archaeon]